MILVYITHPSREAARKVITHLLQKRLIACANLLPIESAYWWNGEIQHDEEVVSIVKTPRENWERVRTEVEAIHPYEVPCIVKIEAEATDAFATWLRSETESPRSPPARDTAP